ncbi:hypothetical protein L9F63_003862, partial [Diploptera punctata]
MEKSGKHSDFVEMKNDVNIWILISKEVMRYLMSDLEDFDHVFDKNNGSGFIARILVMRSVVLLSLYVLDHLVT